MKRKKKTNYLDLIPVMKDNVTLQTNEEGQYYVEVANNGIMDRLAQKLLKKPKVTKVSLEEFGEFIWCRMDGKNSVYDIAMQVRDHFGDKAEPLYERICVYFQTMVNNEFITMKK